MKRAAKLLLWLLAVPVAIWIFCPKPELYGDTPFSTAVYDAHGRLLRLTLASDGRYRLFTPLDEMAPAAVQGTLLYEDQQFYRHPGVNPARLAEAFWTTYVRRTRRVGASTITMQLARIRFQVDSSTVGGKLKQILRAIQLERHYSKRQILEAYLNLAPYGGNVEGIGTASLVYYAKPASQLALNEALSLCVIPQNPEARTPSPRGGPAELDAARLRLAELWVVAHPGDARQMPLLKLRLLSHDTAELPFLAPHFVQQVLAGVPAGSQGRVTTTLDLGLQSLVEKQVRAYVARARAQGIDNAAVLLVDYRDMGVKALVGSADFHDAAIDGQVNGTDAKRSPGSALKPFIYGLALQQGLIHPLTLLKDAPVRFGTYTPENFEHTFVGPLSATQALVQSRNVPAVDLLAELRKPGFYGLLQQAGITDLRSEDYYGLALALGGAEVTMQEMLRLYAALPNGGVMRPLRFTADQKPADGPALLSPEASFLTLEMLGDNPRLDTTAVSTESGDPFPVYWKTGTSFAFRDAWSVGVFGPYVMAVWVGNFDGSSNAAFVGREAAGPLFFDLVDELHDRVGGFARFRADPRGLNVRRVAVCTDTGDLPNRYCPRTTETWFIPGVSPIRMSDIYRRVGIDTRTGRRACQPGAADVRYQVYEFWPSDLLKLFREAGIQRRVPPPFDKGCSLDLIAGEGVPPHISSPQSGVTYSLPSDQLSTAQVSFTAVTDADTRTLFWFVDDRFVGNTPRDRPFFWPMKPGSYSVRVVDDQGRVDVKQMLVDLVPVAH